MLLLVIYVLFCITEEVMIVKKKKIDVKFSTAKAAFKQLVVWALGSTGSIIIEWEKQIIFKEKKF